MSARPVSALVLLVALAALPAAHAQTPAWLRSDSRALTGTWAGIYECPQGPTGIDLALRGDAEGGLKATFSFYPVDANPGVPSGAYRMVGAHYVDGHLTLVGDRWGSRPTDYVMVDLEGWVVDATQILATVCGNEAVLSRR